MRDMIKEELNKGVTQRDLAKRIGFSHGTIQKILFTDTKYTYETRKKVADYFRVPVAHFYDAANEVTPKQADPKPPDPKPPNIDFLHSLILIQATSIAELHRCINDLHGSIRELGGEIGEIKNRMLDAADSGDVHRLRLVVRNGEKDVGRT